MTDGVLITPTVYTEPSLDELFGEERRCRERMTQSSRVARSMHPPTPVPFLRSAMAAPRTHGHAIDCFSSSGGSRLGSSLLPGYSGQDSTGSEPPSKSPTPATPSTQRTAPFRLGATCPRPPAALPRVSCKRSTPTSPSWGGKWWISPLLPPTSAPSPNTSDWRNLLTRVWPTDVGSPNIGVSPRSCKAPHPRPGATPQDLVDTSSNQHPAPVLRDGSPTSKACTHAEVHTYNLVH